MRAAKIGESNNKVIPVKPSSSPNNHMMGQSEDSLDQARRSIIMSAETNRLDSYAPNDGTSNHDASNTRVINDSGTELDAATTGAPFRTSQVNLMERRESSSPKGRRAEIMPKSQRKKISMIRTIDQFERAIVRQKSIYAISGKYKWHHGDEITSQSKNNGTAPGAGASAMEQEHELFKFVDAALPHLKAIACFSSFRRVYRPKSKPLATSTPGLKRIAFRFIHLYLPEWMQDMLLTWPLSCRIIILYMASAQFYYGALGLKQLAIKPTPAEQLQALLSLFLNFCLVLALIFSGAHMFWSSHFMEFLTQSFHYCQEDPELLPRLRQHSLRVGIAMSTITVVLVLVNVGLGLQHYIGLVTAGDYLALVFSLWEVYTQAFMYGSGFFSLGQVLIEQRLVLDEVLSIGCELNGADEDFFSPIPESMPQLSNLSPLDQLRHSRPQPGVEHQQHNHNGEQRRQSSSYQLGSADIAPRGSIKGDMASTFDGATVDPRMEIARRYMFLVAFCKHRSHSWGVFLGVVMITVSSVAVISFLSLLWSTKRSEELLNYSKLVQIFYLSIVVGLLSIVCGVSIKAEKMLELSVLSAPGSCRTIAELSDHMTLCEYMMSANLSFYILRQRADKQLLAASLSTLLSCVMVLVSKTLSLST